MEVVYSGLSSHVFCLVRRTTVLMVVVLNGRAFDIMPCDDFLVVDCFVLSPPSLSLSPSLDVVEEFSPPFTSPTCTLLGFFNRRRCIY